MRLPGAVGTKTIPLLALSSGSEASSGSDDSSDDDEDDSGPEGYLAVPGSVLSKRVVPALELARTGEESDSSESGSGGSDDLEVLASSINASLQQGKVSGKSVRTSTTGIGMTTTTEGRRGGGDGQGNMSFNRMLGTLISLLFSFLGWVDGLFSDAELIFDFSFSFPSLSFFRMHVGSDYDAQRQQLEREADIPDSDSEED